MTCANNGDLLCDFVYPPPAFTDVNNPFGGSLTSYVHDLGELAIAGKRALAWAHWGTVPGTSSQLSAPVRMAGVTAREISDVTAT